MVRHYTDQPLAPEVVERHAPRQVGGGHLGHRLRVETPVVEPVRQDQRVGQAVRHMENTADRIGEGVHGGHRRIGKRLACQQCAQQHGLPRSKIGGPVCATPARL